MKIKKSNELIYKLEITCDNAVVISEFLTQEPTDDQINHLLISSGYDSVLLRNAQTSFVGINRELVDYSNGLDKPVYLDYTERKEIKISVERIPLIDFEGY